MTKRLIFIPTLVMITLCLQNCNNLKSRSCRQIVDIEKVLIPSKMGIDSFFLILNQFNESLTLNDTNFISKPENSKLFILIYNTIFEYRQYLYRSEIDSISIDQFSNLSQEQNIINSIKKTNEYVITNRISFYFIKLNVYYPSLGETSSYFKIMEIERNLRPSLH